MSEIEKRPERLEVHVEPSTTARSLQPKKYIWGARRDANNSRGSDREPQAVTVKIVELEDPRGTTEFVLAGKLPRDRHPVLVYLSF